MGFNTAAILLNDCAWEIERDHRLMGNIQTALASGRGGGVGSGVTLLPSCHADMNQIVLVGGNRIKAIGCIRGGDPDKEAVLRMLASDLGYSLRRKAPKS